MKSWPGLGDCRLPVRKPTIWRRAGYLQIEISKIAANFRERLDGFFWNLNY